VHQKYRLMGIRLVVLFLNILIKIVCLEKVSMNKSDRFPLLITSKSFLLKVTQWL